MFRNLNGTGMLDHSESGHKDVVITSLKKELFELKDLEHDFLRLNDEVANIESKYSLLLDEKERTENEHKYLFRLSLGLRWILIRKLLVTFEQKLIH